MKKILVIIPTYNEAANIDEVVVAVEQVALQARAYRYSLLIVDDKSPDGTARHVRALQKKYGNIHLSSGKKAGIGRAYIRGMRYALKHITFDVCIMMDGDMSHNPRDIPDLLKALNSKADYVIGSRYVSGSSVSSNWPLVRVITSRVANFMARKLVGVSEDVTDLTGGFKAINHRALETIDLSNIHASGYIFQVSLLHAFISKGFIVREVPITFTNRSQGKSKLKLRDIIEFLYCAYKLNRNAPMQQIVRFGFVGVCGSIVNLAILSFLVRVAHFDAVLSVAIAIEVSILFNFFLNHLYTFRGYGSYAKSTQQDSPRSILRKMAIYNAGALGGAAISFTMFTFLYKLLHINYLAADIISILIAMSWNYYMSTRLVWKAIDREVE